MKKTVWFLVLVLMVCGGGYYILYQTNLLRVTTITYNKNDQVTLEALQEFSGVHTGMIYFKVDLMKAADGISTHPFVERATVGKSFPNHVDFDITYRVPFFSVKNMDSMLSLDDQLVVLEITNDVQDGYMVEGFPIERFTTGERLDVNGLYILSNIVDLITLFEKAQIPCEKVIRHLDRHILFKVPPYTVNFGIGDEPEIKFNRFVAVLEAVREKKASGGTIDVSTSGYPVFRPFGE